MFATFTVTEFKPPVINGTVEFTGGTGKYAGITGKGTFHLVSVGEKAATDELIADYTIPEAGKQLTYTLLIIADDEAQTKNHKAIEEPPTGGFSHFRLLVRKKPLELDRA